MQDKGNKVHNTNNTQWLPSILMSTDMSEILLKVVVLTHSAAVSAVRWPVWYSRFRCFLPLMWSANWGKLLTNFLQAWQKEALRVFGYTQHFWWQASRCAAHTKCWCFVQKPVGGPAQHLWLHVTLRSPAFASAVFIAVEGRAMAQDLYRNLLRVVSLQSVAILGKGCLSTVIRDVPKCIIKVSINERQEKRPIEGWISSMTWVQVCAEYKVNVQKIKVGHTLKSNQ